MLKIAVLVTFIGVGIGLWETRLWARKLRQKYIVGSLYLENHRFWATFSLAMALGAVVLTEIMVRESGGVEGGWLFRVHLFFAIPFMGILLWLRLFQPGTKSARTHKQLAYVCLGSYVGAFTTGAFLLFK